MSRISSLILLAVLAGPLAGCGQVEVDKTGGAAARETRVLRLANANDNPLEMQAYADAVVRASDGRLRIEFANNWRSGDPDYEAGIFDDVRAGKVDLAWVGVRAMRAEGVSELDPLIAPFAVTDYATERTVLRSRVAATMLDGVRASGVEGVALLPGPLRLLGMREPWNGAGDLAGKRIGAQASTTGEEAIEALGARVVALARGGPLGDLDGAEQHLASYLGNGYVETIPNIATDALWPRPLVVIANRAAWERLDEADRTTLVRAGRLAIDPMLDSIRELERSVTAELCRNGARFFHPDLADLRLAVAPVYASLRSHAANAEALDAIERMRAPSATPISCPAETATRPAAGLPTGTYRWTISRAEARRYPGIDADTVALTPAAFRAVIEPGRLVLWVSERGGPETFGSAFDISVFEDRVRLNETNNQPITARWSVEDGDLRLSDVHGPDPGDALIWGTKPLRRTG
jgi:TRAP-type C4-dicarboxylate transport system substrate-binding protein